VVCDVCLVCRGRNQFGLVKLYHDSCLQSGDHRAGTLAQIYSEKLLCRYQSLNDARGDNSPFFTLLELQDIHSS
jgi:hypothetical protein